MLRNRSHIWRIASAALVVGALSACTVVEGKQSGDEYMDDAGITTKVKTQLASDVGLTPANQIHVETSNRVVQLSGFVDSAEARSRAEQLARDMDGVKPVRNSLQVRKSEG